MEKSESFPCCFLVISDRHNHSVVLLVSIWELFLKNVCLSQQEYTNLYLMGYINLNKISMVYSLFSPNIFCIWMKELPVEDSKHEKLMNQILDNDIIFSDH